MEGACCCFSGSSSCAASRAGGGGDGVQAAAWPGRTVCKVTHDDHTAWAVQTPPAPLCTIDLERRSSRPVAGCSPVCLTAVPSVWCAMPGGNTQWATSPQLWTPWACSEAASLLASAESGNTTAGLPCCVPCPHARPKLSQRWWWRPVAWWSGCVRCLFPGWRC